MGGAPCVPPIVLVSIIQLDKMDDTCYTLPQHQKKQKPCAAQPGQGNDPERRGLPGQENDSPRDPPLASLGDIHAEHSTEPHTTYETSTTHPFGRVCRPASQKLGKGVRLRRRGPLDRGLVAPHWGGGVVVMGGSSENRVIPIPFTVELPVIRCTACGMEYVILALFHGVDEGLALLPQENVDFCPYCGQARNRT